MGKKKSETTQEHPFMKELLDNGTTTLTAKTRDELAEMVNGIEAEVIVGAAGRNRETGWFTLQVELSKQ